MSKKYSFQTFKGDLVGGLTSAIIAIPLSLAFGVASGLGAMAGLYGSIILCLIAGIFGGAKTQMSGPTAPMTVIIASAMLMFPNDPQSIFTIIFLAGIFQLILTFTKVAELVKFVPYPVISGFMSGIGVIIILIQANPLIGAKIIGSPINTLLNYGDSLQQLNPQSLLLGVVTLLILFFTPEKLNKMIPSSLIALVLGTSISMHYGFNVATIGELPSMLPYLHIPYMSFTEFTKFIPISLTLAIIGAVDSLLVALVIDSMTKTQHDSSKVLFGQGIANAVAGLFGAICGSGAIMRTAVNIKAGGKTRLSAIIHSVALILIVLKAGPLAANVPMAVLAGILIKVATHIIDIKFLKITKYAPKHDLYVMILVFLLTVFDDLIFAVGAGVTLSAILFAARVANQTQVGVKELCDKEIIKLESETEKATEYKIRIFHIEGQFFFGTATQIVSQLDHILGTKYLILNYDSATTLDISAIFALEDIIVRLQSQGIRLLLVIKNEEIKNQLTDLNIVQQIGPKHIFFNEIEAINLAKKYLKRNVSKIKRK